MTLLDRHHPAWVDNPDTCWTECRIDLLQKMPAVMMDRDYRGRRRVELTRLARTLDDRNSDASRNREMAETDASISVNLLDSSNKLMVNAMQ